MLYYLGGLLKNYWGPARLLQSYAVLIGIALYTGFFLTKIILPKFYKFLPYRLTHRCVCHGWQGTGRTGGDWQ